MATILNLELDLPLADTPASRFLAWIAGGLVFLAVLTLALASAAGGTARRLALEPRIVTVALPASAGAIVADTAMGEITAALEHLDGVAFVRVVPPEEVSQLVQPWLTPDADAAGLALPRLVDVAFNPGREPDLAALSARLLSLAPGAMIDQAPPPGDSALRTASALRALGHVATLLLLATLLVVVVVVTRMSLDLHEETVDLLRLMGAGDDYVGRQFEQHALSNALRGGLLGFTAAIVTVGAFVIATTAGSMTALPRLELATLDWLLLGCVPVAAALLTAVVARRTARWGLAHLR